jgi:hypothetical protein
MYFEDTIKQLLTKLRARKFNDFIKLVFPFGLIHRQFNPHDMVHFR